MVLLRRVEFRGKVQQLRSSPPIGYKGHNRDPQVVYCIILRDNCLFQGEQQE